MKKYLLGLFLALSLLHACGPKESSDPGESGPDILPPLGQVDMDKLGSSNCTQPDTSLADHSVWPLCSQAWVQTFSYVNQLDTQFTFQVHADTLNNYMNACSSTVKGLRAYFALTDSFTYSQSQPLDTSLMRIILIPFGIEGDQFVDLQDGLGDEPYLMLGGGSPSRIDSSTASGYVQNWVEYDTTNLAYAPVWAYNYSKVTLDNLIPLAKKKGSDKHLYLILGMRTVGADDPFYCAPSNTPASESGKEGFLVFTSVLATHENNSSTLTHTKDFARPCPKFCGGGLVSTE